MRKTNTVHYWHVVVRTKILKQMSSTSWDAGLFCSTSNNLGNVCLSIDRQSDRQAGTGRDKGRQTASNCFYLTLFFKSRKRSRSKSRSPSHRRSRRSKSRSTDRSSSK